MHLFRTLLLCCCCAAACADGPSTEPSAGRLSGSLWVTGPVQGATVSAYALDVQTGAPGALVGQAVTDPRGHFELDTGIHRGPVLLDAGGAAAQYVEPASGAEARFEAATRLRAVVVQWDDPRAAPSFAFEVFEQRDDVMINPWTELAVQYADTRYRLGLSDGYAAALADSLALWREHLEFAFWRVEPRALTDGPIGPIDERARAGVLAAGLSQLARRIAVQSSLSPAAVSSLSVLDALELDLTGAGGRLDGCARALCGTFEDHLRVGACPEPDDWTDPGQKPICTLSGRTLRADWLESVAAFLSDPTVNQSDLVFGGAIQQLMERIAARESDLFPDADGAFDTEGPVIAIEPGAPADLQPTAIVAGTITFRVTVVDAVQMADDDQGGVAPILVARGETEHVEGQPGGPVVVRSAPDPRTRVLEVSFDTAVVVDGPVTLRIAAYDAAGNDAVPIDWTLHVNNSPNGTVAGTVMAGGRIDGAQVTIVDYTGGAPGAELGSAITDEDGFFVVTLAESPATTSLLVRATKPVDAEATYVETSNATTIALSTDDLLEAVIADYVEGQTRNVQVTPWTHIGTSFARGLFATKYFAVPDLWDDAVDDAFALLESHVADGGPSILLRTVRPADMTAAHETTTLNAQARYGLLVAGLGQLADAHAAASFMTPSAMNTLTLTERLARDLADDPFGEPLLDGGSSAGPITHGAVDASSYWTRVDLSVAIINFVEENPNDTSSFTESDILGLLDWIALDDNPRLYPVSDEPIAYDLIPPGPVAFDSPPTPADAAVLKGTIALQVHASDNRKLTGLSWTTPGVTGVLLDSSAGPEGPWVLSGSLATGCAVEGPLELRARATDEALNTTDAVRTVIVDCTPPDLALAGASAAGGPIAPGGWTGAAAITLGGTVTDANGVASASYSWQGGPSSPLTIDPAGAWSLTLPMSEGANTLVVTAIDPAGNMASPLSVTYHRDATPPVVVKPTAPWAATVVDEKLCTVTTSADPTVSYDCAAASTQQVQTGLSYTKYVTRYLDPTTPGVENLPEWRFDVADNRTPDVGITFEFRILHGATVAVDWTAVAHDDHADYNRSVLVHGGLAPYLAEHSGDYRLEYRATDEFGNVSAPASVSWTQTLRAPPLHLTGGDVAGHLRIDPARIAEGYTLGGAPLMASGGVNNFAALVKGDIPSGTMRVAVWQVSNPNPVAVHFRPVNTVIGITWSAQRRHRNEYISSLADLKRGCGDGLGDQNLSGTACYVAGTHDALTADKNNSIGQIYNGTIEAYLLTPGSPELLSACAGCEANERELPAHSQAIFFALSDPWDFLQLAGPVSDLASFGTLSDVTGHPGGQYRHCTKTIFVGGELACDDQAKYQELEHYTRALVTYSSATQSRVQSRLRPSAEGFSPLVSVSAPATTSATGTTQPYATSETGFGPYTSHAQF